MVPWREEFESRPLLVIAGALAIGMAASYVPWHIAFLGPLLLLASKRRTYVLLIALAAVGWWSGSGGPVRPVMDRQYVEGVVTAVSAARPDPRGERLIARSGDLRLVMSWPNEERADLGDRLWVAGVLTPHGEASEGHWTFQGVAGRLRPARVAVLERGPAWVRAGNDRRRDFVRFASSHMPEDAAVVANAICFNHDVDLAPEVREALRRSGTIHVVSTSGLHVMLLALMVMKTFGYLPIPRVAQVLLLGALLALYVAAAGLRAPAARAAVIAMLYFAAYLVGREEDSISALAAAGAGYLLWEPHGLFDPGLQLSFVIFGALVLFARCDEAVRHGRISGRSLVSGSLVAWSAATPLVAYHFGWVSWTGPVANLMVAPIVPLAVATPLVAWIASPIAPCLSGLLAANFAVPMAYGIVWAAAFAGGHEWAASPTPAFSAYWLPAIYGLALLLWRPLVRRAA
jgi:ComEC/Rec2-related protein